MKRIASLSVLVTLGLIMNQNVFTLSSDEALGAGYDRPAKDRHQKKLPKVFLVFMPMRANLHELEAFVKLCRDVKADRLVLRPLNATLGNQLVWDRAGYHFDSGSSHDIGWGL